MKIYYYLLTLFTSMLTLNCFAQFEIGETCTGNISIIQDEDGSYEDWFEVRNLGMVPTNIGGYGLSDDPTNPLKWICPNVTMAPNERQLVFASGKDRVSFIDHYEGIILANQTWNYLVPTSEPTNSWRLPGATLTGWSSGIGGIGFGDGDDGTTIPTATSVYLRRSFTLSATTIAELKRLILYMDFDDGFVAYLNGVEIARSNLGIVGVTPAFNTLASNHEANGYQGLTIDSWEIPEAVFLANLQVGENVLAIQVHNSAANSTDLTSNAYLAGGFSTATQTFSATLPWMNLNAVDEWHTNFTINVGDQLFLSDPSGNVLGSVTLPLTPVDHSYNNAGGLWCISPTPTPAAANSTPCFSQVLEKPTFSKPAGIYASGFKVAISTAQPNTEIRYTLDGSIPTQSSLLYTDSVVITNTKVLSARCFDLAAGSLPSLVEKNSFIINESYIGIPVISLSTDSLNLYDTQTGIYVLGPPDYNVNYPYFGANFWEDWERYSYIEYFATDSLQRFEGAIGLKIHGGWSRAKAQKSFRIKCRDDYGMNKIYYPLIPDKPHIDKYKDFNLRNGGNDYDGTRMRDAFMQRLTKSTHCDYMGYTPVIVFLNGSYFGEYELRETLNNDYVENNHDIPSDSVTVLTENYLEGLNANDGSLEDFWPMYNAVMAANPLSPSFFPLVDSLIDLENFADYIIAETYYGNGDWSNTQANNIKYWHAPGEKWRMMLMDLDFGYGLYNSLPTDDFLSHATNNANVHLDNICNQLFDNVQFRNYFIDRYADLINTIWQQNNVVALGNTMINELAPWIPRHHTRWSGNMNNFLNGMTNMFNWNQTRIQGARNVVQTYFGLTGQVTFTLDAQPAGAGRIHISTIEPNESELPWSGVYFKGVPVKITAIPNPGYTFDHWSPNTYFTTNNYQHELTITPTGNAGFTAWFIGSAVSDPIEVSEIMPNAEASIDGGDWFEIYNKTNVPVNIGGYNISDSSYFNQFQLPYDFEIPANGRVVVASDTTLFKSQYPSVTNVVGPLGFNLSNSGETIFIKNHVGAMAEQVTYSTSWPWPLGADGHGRSLEFTGYPASVDNPSDWYSGCVGGSPGQAFVPCDSSVIVSEINYLSSTASDAGDWFELLSTMETDLDLSGWTVTDGNLNAPYTFAAGSILSAGQRLVIFKDAALFNAVHPTVTNSAGPVSFSLGNTDAILVYDNNGTLRFSVDYRDELPWAIEANGNGYTLELLSSTGMMNEGSNWFAGCPNGSPGGIYIAGCGASTHELDQTSFILYPNPTSESLTLQGEMLNGKIRIIDLLGNVYLEEMVTDSNTTFSVESLPNGVYLFDYNGSVKQFVKM
jgi:hypothetical protein